MAQHNNEHLTIAQLSAYLDRELTSDELALFDAHLQTCQSCQQALTDLRLASSLLHAMPQVTTPRSFTLLLDLPTSAEGVLHRGAHTPLNLARRQSTWRRSLRILSSVAAVLGLLFILTGLGGFTRISNSSSSSAVTTAGSSISSGSAPSSASSTKGEISPQVVPATRSTLPAGQTDHGVYTTSPPAQSTSGEPFSLPSALNPGLPEGRLVIGLLIFVLGILGFAATRRNSRKTFP